MPASCPYRILFALQGGTLISQFKGGLPGLSVDIDLVCLPVTEREDSLRGIGSALYGISKHANKSLPSARMQSGAPHPNHGQDQRCYNRNKITRLGP
ncbi:MAG: nucleotidyl transferase AbiEii/AbiGii toxin family protein [Gammaproteobacteria bacterium]|nr:nucleotidyl transferase AbiEii/AbiGii toxin family protein [Gammaproteobacteria bacterium]MYG67198.1 nucleotidyl transferase AbiEii/AbiGii toxin family protein [Gammaproteobacteria bacterium]